MAPGEDVDRVRLDAIEKLRIAVDLHIRSDPGHAAEIWSHFNEMLKLLLEDGLEARQPTDDPT